MKYGVVVPARERLSVLEKTLRSIRNQSRAPDYVVVVDDGCEEGVEELVEAYGFTYVRFPLKHSSWTGKPQLSLVFNMGIRQLPLRELDFFAIVGSDTVLERRYFEKVLEAMSGRVAVASGIVVGERSKVPRGTGRVFNVSFWRRHIHSFPLCWSWESYPLYKALACGWKLKVVKNALMWVQRPTKTYKPEYGYAMREMGFQPWYVLGKAIRWMLKSPSSSVRLLTAYLFSPYKPFDQIVVEYTRRYQLRRVLELLRLR